MSIESAAGDMYVDRESRFDLDTFKTSMSNMPAGVTVITTVDKHGRRAGGTLSAVTSLSLDPPMLLACFDRDSNTLDALREPGHPFLLHVLSDGQQEVAGIFAGKAENKFAAVDWHSGLLQLPELNGSASVVGCHVNSLIPAGDHVIVTATAVAASNHPSRAPLVYHRRNLIPMNGTGDSQ